VFRQRLVRASPIRVLSLLIASLVWCVFAASTARADAFTERFQEWARAWLHKPYHRAPYPCDLGWSLTKDYYVVDVTPWAAASDLRRGDRLVAFGGISLAGEEWDEVWAKVPRERGMAWQGDDTYVLNCFRNPSLP
jgi:hypothetical protein